MNLHRGMPATSITLITPCRNAGSLLAETVSSVLNQKAVHTGRVELQYLIIDGASTDGSLGDLPDHPSLCLISEQDAGIYDAVAKGLEQATGQVHGYLGAGDLLHPLAFDVIADVMDRAPWITGMSVILNHRGDLVSVDLPYRYRQRLFQDAAYGRSSIGFLQQESTFWISALTDEIDLDRLRSFRLAGDAYLWSRFAQCCPLTIVGAHLGGFRDHPDHASSDIEGYFEELEQFAGSVSITSKVLSRLDRCLWYAPRWVKKYFNPSGLLIWDGNSYE